MPDHDTFDLDAAFRGLEQDIAGASSPRAAGAAISVARRRRRTAIGGAVAGLALVVGAAVVGQGLATRDASVGPAELPSPAPFDASALTSATQGWTASEWRTPTKSDGSAFTSDSAPRCLSAIEGTTDKQVTPDPARTGGGLLATDGEMSLSTLVGWNDDHPDASAVGYAAVLASVDVCGQATAAHDYAWDGAQGRSWTITVGGQETQHLWVVRTDRAVGVLWAGGSAGPVPDAVDERVISALLSGLGSPQSFDQSLTPGKVTASASGSSGPVVSGTSLSTVGDEEFSHAVAGWHNGWRQDAGSGSVDQVPCVDNWEGNAASATGSSLGANGDQEYGQFASAAEASSAVSLIRKSFASCAGPAYLVTTPAGVDPASALVASGPEVVWVVQHDTTVGVIAIPGGGSAPPEQVTADVMSLMTAAMNHQPPVETTAPAPSGS